MMHQSISKKRIYFYLLILLFLSSTFNFNIISKFTKINLIESIKIIGISEKEKNILEKNLEIFLNKNIFLVTREEVGKAINNNNFFDNYNVVKVLPSKLLVKIKKTEFIGKTILDGEKFYIGKNGKFINSNQISDKYKTSTVFGEFEINEFLNLYNILNNQKVEIVNIEEYYYFKNKRWDLVFSNGLILKLPSKNIIDSIKIYKQLLDNVNLTNTKIIDLRIINQIILTKNNE